MTHLEETHFPDIPHHTITSASLLLTSFEIVSVENIFQLLAKQCATTLSRFISNLDNKSYQVIWKGSEPFLKNYRDQCSKRFSSPLTPDCSEPPSNRPASFRTSAPMVLKATSHSLRLASALKIAESLRDFWSYWIGWLLIVSNSFLTILTEFWILLGMISLAKYLSWRSHS